MNQVLYTGVDISVDEYNKEFLINPKGERFYCISRDQRSMVYEDAALVKQENGTYLIEGIQTLFNKYKGRNFNYAEMVSFYPEQLIQRHSFMGIVWYTAKGTMTRRVRVRYCCRHNEYAFVERKEILSHVFGED